MTGSLSRRWYHEPYVWFVLAIPLSSVLVGAVMLWFALQGEDGLVVDDYYKRGLEINRTLSRDVKARKYGLSSAITFNTAAGNMHAMLDADPHFNYPESIQLGLYHATRSGFDQEVNLNRISDKGYSGMLPDLVAGRWYLAIWSGQWRLTGNMVWPTESASLTFLPANSEP